MGYKRATLTRDSDGLVLAGPVVKEDADFDAWFAGVSVKSPWNDPGTTATVEDWTAQVAQEEADAAQNAADAADRAARGRELRDRPVLTPQETKEAIDIIITELFG